VSISIWPTTELWVFLLESATDPELDEQYRHYLLYYR
jgi:hypothetical protein